MFPPNSYIGSQEGVWQIALPIGVSVAVAVFLSSAIGDGHINPAVTLSYSIVRWRHFQPYRTIPNILAQVLGAFLAGPLVFVFYYSAIEDFETTHNITRGEDGSQQTATVFARYFPNPMIYNPRDPTTFDIVPVWKALLVESWATFVFVFVIFAITHPQNVILGKHQVFVPVIIGMMVAVLVSTYAPLTQTGINPAFDFGPRLFASMVGWGRIAIPGPRNGFWVYILGPLIGGPLGGGTNDFIQYIVRKLRSKRASVS